VVPVEPSQPDVSASQSDPAPAAAAQQPPVSTGVATDLDRVLSAIADADHGQPVQVIYTSPTGVAVVDGKIFEYGDRLEITRPVIDSCRDRFGGLDAVISMLADPAQQVQRSGSVSWIRAEDFPPQKLTSAPGSHRWYDLRQRYYSAARMLPEESARKAALAECRRCFGDDMADTRRAPAPYGATISAIGPDGTLTTILDPHAGDAPRPELFGSVADSDPVSTAPRQPMSPAYR
jgi:hypothetical protein